MCLSEGAPISLIESIILGLVQGATEFLPISSSGHLVIMHTLFGAGEPQLLFDVMLHVGTLAAIVVVFRKDLARLGRAACGIFRGGNTEDHEDRRLVMAIVIGCVPTALIGVGFSEHFERLFASITAAGTGLLATGIILMSTAWREKIFHGAESRFPGRVGAVQALVIGAVQGLAIFPGVSRSGTTIAVALLLGIERESAARFSFLLAIPAIAGAFIFELKDFQPATSPGITGMATMLSGMIVAAITGIVALRFLLGIVKRGRISLFAYYCWALGLLAICFGVLRG